MKHHKEGDRTQDLNVRAEDMIGILMKASGNEFECAKIAGRRFDSIGDHAEFIRRGGCVKVIYALGTKNLTGTSAYNLDHKVSVEII